MKSTGIVRKLDDLGRLVIPREIRKIQGIPNGQPMEVFMDGDNIVIRPYNPGCDFCGSMEHVKNVDGEHKLCPDCIMKIKRL
jgi:transcriptional pleiotropic regulator of transition state genes